jgi:hypothetical protein
MTFRSYCSPAPHGGGQENTGHKHESHCSSAVEGKVAKHHPEHHGASPYACDESGLSYNVQDKVSTQKRNKKRRRYKQNA